MQVRDGWAWLVSMPDSIRRLVTFPVDGVHSARLGRTVSREDVDDRSSSSGRQQRQQHPCLQTAMVPHVAG